MQLLSIDPGNERSAWVRFDGAAIVDSGIAESALAVAVTWSDTKRGMPPRATTGSTDEGARTA